MQKNTLVGIRWDSIVGVLWYGVMVGAWFWVLEWILDWSVSAGESGSPEVVITLFLFVWVCVAFGGRMLIMWVFDKLEGRLEG